MYRQDPDYLMEQDIAKQEREVAALLRDVDPESRRRVEDVLCMFPNLHWKQCHFSRTAIVELLVALDRTAFFEGHEKGYRAGKRFMADALRSSLAASTTEQRMRALKEAAS